MKKLDLSLDVGYCDEFQGVSVMEERKISKYNLLMHLAESQCAAMCELLMPGVTILQVSSQRSGTSTVNLKVLAKDYKS